MCFRNEFFYLCRQVWRLNQIYAKSKGHYLHAHPQRFSNDLAQIAMVYIFIFSSYKVSVFSSDTLFVPWGDTRLAVLLVLV